MKNIMNILIVLGFAISGLQAQIEVSVKETKQTGQKALVELEMKNTYSQNLKAARVWVFLMDEKGKVVGQKAQWLVGNEPNKEANAGTTLEAGKQEAYSVALDTNRSQRIDEKPFQAKITYSRLILEDGTLLNPQKAVTSPKQKEQN